MAYGIEELRDDEVLAIARQIKDAGARWRKALEKSSDPVVSNLIRRCPNVLRRIDREEIMRDARQVAEAFGEAL